MYVNHTLAKEYILKKTGLPILLFVFTVLVFSAACGTAKVGQNKYSIRQATPDKMPQLNNAVKRQQQAGGPEDILHIMPVSGKIISEYGYRKLYTKKPRLHKGIDIDARRGSVVVASGDGKVVHAANMGAYGRTVDIDHGQGITTRYAHLQKITVKPGDVIQAGDKIGTVGSSGRTTGPNLHFEVHLNNQHQNPLTLVKWVTPSMQAQLKTAPKRIALD